MAGKAETAGPSSLTHSVRPSCLAPHPASPHLGSESSEASTSAARHAGPSGGLSWKGDEATRSIPIPSPTRAEQVEAQQLPSPVFCCSPPTLRSTGMPPWGYGRPPHPKGPSECHASSSHSHSVPANSLSTSLPTSSKTLAFGSPPTSNLRQGGRQGNSGIMDISSSFQHASPPALERRPSALFAAASTKELVGYVVRPVKSISVELITHVLLAFIILAYVWNLSGHHLSYMRHNRELIQDMATKGNCSSIKRFQELRNCIESTVSNVASMGEDSFSPMLLKGYWPQADAIACLDVVTLDDGGQVLNLTADGWTINRTLNTYYITDPKAPFADSILVPNRSSTHLYELYSVTLHVRYRDLNYYNHQRVCVVWHVKIVYEVLMSAGVLKPTVIFDQNNCSRPDKNSKTIILNSLIVFLSAISFALAMHSLIMSLSKKWHNPTRWFKSESTTHSCSMATNHQHQQTTPIQQQASGAISQTPMRLERLQGMKEPLLETVDYGRDDVLLPPQIFSELEMGLHSDLSPIKAWWIICAVGNCLQFGTALYIILNGRPTGDKYTMNLIGLGGLFAWVNLLRYCECAPRFYVLILTLERSFPDILRFMASCMPVVLGYATMGMAIFGASVNEFASFHSTMETLFALMNGDSVLQIMQEGDTIPYTGSTYVTTFMLLFVCAVMNIFITIVMHSYESVSGYSHHSQVGSHVPSRRHSARWSPRGGNIPYPQQDLPGTRLATTRDGGEGGHHH